MNSQNLELDLSKRGMAVQSVAIGQGDHGGTTIVASITDNGVAANLAGGEAVFCARLPNRTDYVRDSSATASGSTITYVVDEPHVASVPGYTEDAYFEVTLGGKTYSTERFALDIARAADSGAKQAGSYDTVAEAALKSANEAVAKCDAATGKANAAASNANAAASKANTEAANLSALKSSCESAAKSANSGASAANAAAAAALAAASQAAQGSAGDSDVAALKRQNYDIYGKLADATAAFIFSEGTIFCPAAKAGASGSAVSFGGTCSANGSTITLK